MATTRLENLAQPSAALPVSFPVAEVGKCLPDKLLGEVVGLLYGQAGKGLLGTLISATVLSIVESRVVDHGVMTAWLGTILVVSLFRYVLLLGYRRSETSETRPEFWRNLFIAGAVAAALVWGSASAWLFTPTSIVHQTFLAFVLAGVSAGAAPALAPSLTAAVAFLSLTLLPLAAQFLMQESEMQIAMGSMMIAFFLYLLSVVQWTHGIMRASLALRHSNLDLVKYLDSTKHAAERANQQLQIEIQERRAIERQLSKAKDDAEQASKSKGDFLATISHEIRTPMNGVLGALELLRDMPLGQEQRDLAATAYTSTESLISVINNVLDFSKIGVGRLELEDIEFDLPRLVAEVTELHGKRAESKGLKVAHKVSARAPGTLRGDPTRLRQVLNNLVGNAVKFTPHGGIEVRVDVARSAPSSVMLRFEVEDTGIGIGPVAQTSLFQPFTQAESSMARKYGGTGLGLSISKQLVELMGGRIRLHSEQGKGSTFWFTVTLDKPASAIRRRGADLRGSQLLLVTENPDLRTTLSAKFRRWGASIEFASAGVETIEKLKSSAEVGDTWSYDAVIMDAEYESARLLSLTSEIRSDPTLTGTVLVMIGMKPGELPALEAEVDVCAPTPLNPDALFDALSGLIEESAFSDNFGMVTNEATGEVEPIIIVPSRHLTDAGEETGPTEQPVLATLRGRLLLVEDNPVNQQVAQTVVERLGLSVDLANDGFEAVDAVTDGTYDVVLMDCQMPGMDGLQATQAIRRMEKKNHRDRLPIIAVTANAMEGDRERCVDIGMDDYVAKPFKQEALRDMLAKWLPTAEVSDPTVSGDRMPKEPKQARDNRDLADQQEAKGHILVADDDAVNRKLARASLERLGYSVNLAANGREAIDAATAGGYDAILMDCEMPEVDGIEATREIRRIEQKCSSLRTPILALTGHTERSDRERFLKAGMDDVLAKPIKRDTLAQTLRQHLSPSQADKEAKTMNETKATTANGVAVDSTILADLKEIMEDEFNSLVRVFLKDAPTRIYAIRDGIQARDTDAVRVASHTLKSSAANLGALSLSAQAKKLEMLAREGRLAGSVELLKQMADEYKRARLELTAALTQA